MYGRSTERKRASITKIRTLIVRKKGGFNSREIERITMIASLNFKLSDAIVALGKY